MAFAEYEALPAVIVAPDPLPEDVSVLLKWTVPFGKYKGQTYGYVVTHDDGWLRKLLGWKKLEGRSRDVVARVLDEYDAWKQVCLINAEPNEPLRRAGSHDEYKNRGYVDANPYGPLVNYGSGNPYGAPGADEGDDEDNDPRT